MKRSLAPAIITAAALSLAACGSGDDTSTDTTGVADGSSPSSGAESPATTVEIVNVDGVGEALADAQGRVLYVSDEEAADSNVVCTGACEEFWAPLAAGAGQPTGGPGVSDLGVAARPDGTLQVTYDGRRLYTFTLDAPRQTSGDDLSDTFDGQRFTWHAVVVGNASGTGAGDSDTETSTPTTSRSDEAYPGY